MILVTGAAGKTGRAIIRALTARGRPVRALVHREEQALQLISLGAQEHAVGDMRDPATLAHAVLGIRAVYHICPNMSPDEVVIGRAMIAACRQAGVRRIVYHSVLHPQTEAMPHHWAKLRVEEALFESELGYTILQPAAYMQNVLAGWTAIAERGEHSVPYSVDTRLGMVDLEDVAEAASIVLTDSRHVDATYELAGPEVLSQREVAAVLSRVLSRPVRAKAIATERWVEQARASGMDTYRVRTLAKMFDYYDHYGFWGNPGVLTWLLGRTPRRFEEFVRRTLELPSSSTASS